jgi:hypothetical protein
VLGGEFERGVSGGGIGPIVPILGTGSGRGAGWEIGWALGRLGSGSWPAEFVDDPLLGVGFAEHQPAVFVDDPVLIPLLVGVFSGVVYKRPRSGAGVGIHVEAVNIGWNAVFGFPAEYHPDRYLKGEGQAPARESGSLMASRTSGWQRAAGRPHQLPGWMGARIWSPRAAQH